MPCSHQRHPPPSQGVECAPAPLWRTEISGWEYNYHLLVAQPGSSLGEMYLNVMQDQFSTIIDAHPFQSLASLWQNPCCSCCTVITILIHQFSCVSFITSWRRSLMQQYGPANLHFSRAFCSLHVLWTVHRDIQRVSQFLRGINTGHFIMSVPILKPYISATTNPKWMKLVPRQRPWPRVSYDCS